MFSRPCLLRTAFHRSFFYQQYTNCYLPIGVFPLRDYPKLFTSLSLFFFLSSRSKSRTRAVRRGIDSYFYCVFVLSKDVRDHPVGHQFAIFLPIAAVFCWALFFIAEESMSGINKKKTFISGRKYNIKVQSLTIEVWWGRWRREKSKCRDPTPDCTTEKPP